MPNSGIGQFRNVQTGEIRDVLVDSDEAVGLKAEVYDHGGAERPKWEQTGDHHVRRIDGDGPRIPEDFGYEDKPIGEEQGVAGGPDPAPHTALTPGERESGLESWDQKAEQLGLERTEEGQARLDRGLERVGRTDGDPNSGDSASGGDDTSYNNDTKDDLQDEVDRRGLEVQGSGANSKVLKSDLVSALEAHDSEGAAA